VPLQRKDFNFIFYLGDAAKKPIFEVDEILDIIGSYSLHGRVTLILDEQNAADMWEMRYGTDAHAEISASPGLKEKSRCLFDLTDVSHLIIDSFSATLSFSRNIQFEITPGKSSGTSESRRKYFDVGYILGLILKMEHLHDIILGLAVSGVYKESGSRPDSQRLIEFIEKFMRELESIKQEENLMPKV
jgi:hypothetical protein